MPRHVNRTHPLAQKGNTYDPNWLALERYFNSSLPVCVTSLGDPGTIPAGTPGASSFLTWSPPTNALYDVTNIVGATPTINIRIPMDGFYDFFTKWTINDDISTASLEFLPFVDTANTSDTGLSTPSWTRLYTGPSRQFINCHIDKHFGVLYRGVEMHANDLLRFGIQIWSPIALNQTTVSRSEFRMVYPIPNYQVMQP